MTKHRDGRNKIVNVLLILPRPQGCCYLKILCNQYIGLQDHYVVSQYCCVQVNESKQ